MSPYFKSLLKNGYEIRIRYGILVRGLSVSIFSARENVAASVLVRQEDLDKCGCPQNESDLIDDTVRKEMS